MKTLANIGDVTEFEDDMLCWNDIPDDEHTEKYCQ